MLVYIFPLVPLSEFGTQMILVSKCSFHFYFIGHIGDGLFCKSLVEYGSACWLTLGFCSLRDSLLLLQFHFINVFKLLIFLALILIGHICLGTYPFLTALPGIFLSISLQSLD